MSEFFIAIASISPALAILVSIFLYKSTNKKNAKAEILKINDNLLSLGMQYPYLENDTFCDTWDRNFLENDDKARYNLYCCKIYNMLILLHDHCNKNVDKMKKILDIEDYINTHKAWFSQESDRTENDDLNKLIHSIIKDLDSRKKI